MSDEVKTPDGANRASSDERVQELGDINKALARAEKWKEKAENRDNIIKDLKTQVAELTQTNQLKNSEFEKLYSTEAAKHKSLQERYQVLEQEKVELATMVNNFKTEAIMKQFMDTALGSVKDRPRAEVMLLGLAASGKVDMTPEEGIEDAAAAATKLLQQLDPTLFAPDGGESRSVAGNIPGARLSNSNGAAKMLGKFQLLPTSRK